MVAAILLSTATLALAQVEPIYYDNPGTGFSYIEFFPDERRIAIVEADKAPVRAQRRTVEGGQFIDVLVQEVKVLSGRPGVHSSLEIVGLDSLRIMGSLPVGGRYIVVYLVPSNDTLKIRRPHKIIPETGDVSGMIAIPTA